MTKSLGFYVTVYGLGFRAAKARQVNRHGLSLSAHESSTRRAAFFGVEARNFELGLRTVFIFKGLGFRV